jgi:hypothetical protein
MPEPGHGRLSFLDRRLPPGFRARIVTIPPGGELLFRERDWRDAIVVAERGRVEIASHTGATLRFGHGSLLWFSGLPLRAVRNPGRDPAVLVAVSRRVPDGDLEVVPPPSARMAGRGGSRRGLRQPRTVPRRGRGAWRPRPRGPWAARR